MEKTIITNLRFLYLPLSAIGTIIILLVVSFKLFSDKLSSQQGNLENVKGQEVVLDQKLNALQHIGDLVNNVQNISFALPSDNPSFIEVSQIRRYAQAQGLTLTSIQIGQETTDAQGMMHTNINFDVEGSPISILALIDKLSNATPITTGNNITIDQKGGTTLSTFTISVYWAPFPEQLPKISEPISELTSDDRDVLTKIVSFDLPIFQSPVTASTSGSPTVPKTNPFGF